VKIERQPSTALPPTPGATLRDGSVVTAGGRVLNVTALAEVFAHARERAYAARALASADAGMV